MKRNLNSRRLGLAAIALVTLAGVGAAGFANAGGLPAARAALGEQEASDDASEAAMLAAVRIPLGDAARIAEQRTGLKAAEAELDDEARAPVWEISLGAGAQEKIVKVDAINGQVSSVAADDGEAEESGDAD